jgi:hypothetical protein
VWLLVLVPLQLSRGVSALAVVVRAMPGDGVSSNTDVAE